MNSNNNIDSNNIFNLEIRDQDSENASLSPVSESHQNTNAYTNNENTNINSNTSSSSSSENTDVDTGLNNYTNYYYNNHNTRNTHNTRNNHNNPNIRNSNNNRNNNRSICRECNYYINRNNYLNTPSYRSRSIDIDRDRYQYLEMYRDTERERQQERERQRDRNMLNQIYSDLLHQNNLLQSMRIDINNIWNRVRLNDDYMRYRYQPNHQTNHQTNPNYNSNINPNPINRQSGSSNQRININGIPYIVENIQRFNIQPRTNATTSDFIDSFMNLMDFQSNVPIIPTRQQILTATRDIQFGDIENPINTTCPISLETFQESDMITQILHCGHNFNTRQLNTWFQSNVRCPMCRYDIREYNNTNEQLNRDHNINNDSETNQPTTSTNTTTDYSERRTRHTPRRIFSESPSFENNFNNVASSLSSIAVNTINELFERNDNIFTENGDSRFLFDPSSNILLFETLINSGNRFGYRNSSSRSNRRSNANTDNQEPRNIV